MEMDVEEEVEVVGGFIRGKDVGGGSKGRFWMEWSCDRCYLFRLCALLLLSLLGFVLDFL